MKAHTPLTAKEKDAVRFVVNRILNSEFDDLGIRVMLLWCKAMKDAGYKASTINNVIKHLPDAMAMYQHFRDYYDKQPVEMRTKDDHIADYMYYDELRSYGVNVRMTKEEL